MKKSRARAASCLAALLVALAGIGDARAEALSTVERVRQLDSTAGYAFQNEDYSTALESLMLAQQLMPATPRLFNIAVCHERLGDRRRAIAAYQRYADAEGAEEDGRAQARERAEALREEIAAEEAAAEEAARLEAERAAAEAERLEAERREAEEAARARREAETPVWRRWWFWVGLVGGMLVVGGTATGLAIGLSPQGPGSGDVEVWLP